jgi:hypothetical protein
VLRELEHFAEAGEQRADRRVPLRLAEVGALPDPVLREQRGDRVRVVVVVADVAVADLELLDRLDVLEPGDALFECREIHACFPCATGGDTE